MNTRTCEHCYKSFHNTIMKDCPLCKEISIAEQILCGVTREAQAGLKTFECAAFRPNLGLVGSTSPASAKEQGGDAEDILSHDIMKSSRVKWFLAFGRQQAMFDAEEFEEEDQIEYDLKYHLCLVSKYRQKTFAASKRHSQNIAGIIKECGKLFEGAAYFLQMGTDHLHVFIDATPEYSIEEIVTHIIAHTEEGLRELLPDSDPHTPLFERTYFVESIG